MLFKYKKSNSLNYISCQHKILFLAKDQRLRLTYPLALPEARLKQIMSVGYTSSWNLPWINKHIYFPCLACPFLSDDSLTISSDLTTTVFVKLTSHKPFRWLMRHLAATCPISIPG